MRAPHLRAESATPPVPHIRLTVLGGFDISDWQGRPLRLRCKKAAAMLAYLVVCGVIAHTRDQLAGLFWEDADMHHAYNSLRQVIFLVTTACRAVAAHPLICSRDTIAINKECVAADIWEFKTSIGEGSPQALRRAVECYRGDLLDGLSIDSLAFTDWLAIERERLRQSVLDICARLLGQHLAQNSTASALRVAQRKLTIDPLDEATHRARHRAGCRNEAPDRRDRASSLG
jgi:DNA-binding SARP family transcriptional activator